jgi:uncharacterized membrane protein YphA (DoxX/SURF4 family)
MPLLNDLSIVDPYIMNVGCLCWHFGCSSKPPSTWFARRISKSQSLIGLETVAGLVMLAVRWFLAGVFLRSGLGKTTGLAQFRAAVANYRLLPAVLVTPVAYTLPLAEIAAGILLALGILPLVVAAALALLLIAFAAAIAVNLARGRVIDCGCAGSVATPQLISWRHVGTDIALAVAATAVAIAPPPGDLWTGPSGLARVAMPAGGAFPVLLSVLVCLVTVTLLRRAGTVIGLARAAGEGLRAAHTVSRPVNTDPRSL